MEELNEQEYYKIPDAASGKLIYVHKDKKAAYVFRGCVDYGFANGLVTLYKHSATQWSFLSIFSDEISFAFADWAYNKFDLNDDIPLKTESAWVEYSKQSEFKDFNLLILRGSLDMYCMFRYLFTVFTAEIPIWEPYFKTLEKEFISYVL